MSLSLKLNSAIKSRPACSYLAHECSGQRIEGYDYCIRHILEDKTAPYRLCSYVYSGNGRRCVMPTPKGDKRESGYVFQEQEVPGRCPSRVNSPWCWLFSVLEQMISHI
jgi:hypothetical protein